MTDTVHDNPARLRTYRVLLYWPTLKRHTLLRLDAVDVWDANAFVRLNYAEATPFGFEAWDEKRHGPELHSYLDSELARVTPTRGPGDDCPGCDGLGREPDECDGEMVERSCRTCDGAGKVPATSDNPVVPTEGANPEGPQG